MAQNSGLNLSNDENVRFLYEKAIEARNFHYDNFTKWQTFFYVAVGSVLVAYCTVLFDSESGCCVADSESSMKEFFKILLPILGYIFSLIWLCSSKGYTYWWNAYMRLVRRFEGERILGWVCDENENFDKNNNKYFAVYNGVKLNPYAGIFNPFAGANFSTSKLANAMAFVSASSWGCVLMVFVEDLETVSSWQVAILTPILCTWLLSTPVVQFFFRSDIKDFVRGRECDPVYCLEQFILGCFSYICSSVLLFVFFTATIGASCLSGKSLVAWCEVWFFASTLLYLVLKRIWKFLN